MNAKFARRKVGDLLKPPGPADRNCATCHGSGKAYIMAAKGRRIEVVCECRYK